jgi:2-methylcitrate dehydratase PrpD
VIIKAWAEEFSRIKVGTPTLRRLIDLHVADIAIAFFAGCRSEEARALARFYAWREPAAAVSGMVRRTECDDIHVASCITPGAIVVPVALALATRYGAPVERFERAVSAGYAVGLRLGMALGGAGALGAGIWPTYFAAPMMAASTAAICLGLDGDHLASAIGLAAAGAGGRVGRPAGLPSGRWFAVGEAVTKGCRAALAAAAGFCGDASMISAEWLAATADPSQIRPEALLGGTVEESFAAVGFKPFVAARQTINAIVAFQRILAQGVVPESISHIEIGVPTINATMVARAASISDRLSTIANMHVQIAAAALRPQLLYAIERNGEPGDDLLTFAERISIVADTTLDAFLPSVWAGRATVTFNRQTIEEVCTIVSGDPGDDGPIEALLDNKLRQMVPESDRAICAAMMTRAGEEERQARLLVLWQAMRAAIARVAET